MHSPVAVPLPVKGSPGYARRPPAIWLALSNEISVHASNPELLRRSTVALDDKTWNRDEVDIGETIAKADAIDPVLDTEARLAVAEDLGRSRRHIGGVHPGAVLRTHAERPKLTSPRVDPFPERRSRDCK